MCEDDSSNSVLPLLYSKQFILQKKRGIPNFDFGMQEFATRKLKRSNYILIHKMAVKYERRPPRQNSAGRQHGRELTTPVLLHQILQATRVDHTDLNQVSATDADLINTKRISIIVQPATTFVLPVENEGLQAYHKAADEQKLLDGVQASGDGATCDAYQQALAVLNGYFAPPEDAFCVWARFRRRAQEPDETPVHFVLALQWLANNCNFSTAAEIIVQDQILHGLRDPDQLRPFIQSRQH
ncbi:hypothetical protein MRX96_010297 [Rhipicephalus microplus]